MEGNHRLNINIEDHIADLYCLFGYFKSMWPFLLTLISLYKTIFLPSRCRTLISLMALSFLPRKDFMMLLWVILSSNCNVIIALNNYGYKSTYSLRRWSFRPTTFKIHLYLEKNRFRKILSKTDIYLFWFRNLKKLKLKKNDKSSSINQFQYLLHWWPFFKQTPGLHKVLNKALH